MSFEAAIKVMMADTLEKVELEVNDAEGNLVALLEYIKETASVGHSFIIVVDPEDPEHKKEFHIDGDGGVTIKKIEVTKQDKKKKANNNPELVVSVMDERPLELFTDLHSSPVYSFLTHLCEATFKKQEPFLVVVDSDRVFEISAKNTMFGIDRISNVEIDINAETVKILYEQQRLTANDIHIEIPSHPDGRDAKEKELCVINYGDIPVVVEIPYGGFREGVDGKGKKWKRPVNCHYGYVRKTKGADNDEIDVYLNPENLGDSNNVYIINQLNKEGDFDEHKVMLGFPDEASAIEMYKSHYPKDWKVGPVKIMDIMAFKEWLKSGDTKSILASTLEEQGYLCSH